MDACRAPVLRQGSCTWRRRGLCKSVISRVTPFRVLISLLITHLLSPLNLQVSNRKPQALHPEPVRAAGVLVTRILIRVLVGTPCIASGPFREA